MTRRRSDGVARDNETLGFDIEDENEDHLIEVKGSVSTEVQFYLSANEYSVMHDNPERYFIHFWGGIDLSKPPPEGIRGTSRGRIPDSD